MYDVRLALADMAQQLRACRAREALTLQQLATRCGVAASTIHKIESQQMVPTISVLLKIARGLGLRPEELVRDRHHDVGARSGDARPNGAEDARRAESELLAQERVGAWRLDFTLVERLGLIPLEPTQRAILIVERGQGEFASHRRIRLESGECVELKGEAFALSSDPADPLIALLVAWPAGRLAEVLGPPNSVPDSGPAPAREA